MSRTLVCINMDDGTLNRWETGGQHVRKTHTATPRVWPMEYSRGMIELFRTKPNPDFAVATKSKPTPPPEAA